MATDRRIRLSNGTGVFASFVVAINYSEETHRVFLKGEGGDTLCSIRCDDEDAARKEIDDINRQMGW